MIPVLPKHINSGGNPFESFDLEALKESSTTPLGTTSHIVTDLYRECSCRQIVARPNTGGILLLKTYLRGFGVLHLVTQGTTSTKLRSGPCNSFLSDKIEE